MHKTLIFLSFFFFFFLIFGCTSQQEPAISHCFDKENSVFNLDCVVIEAIKKDDISLCDKIDYPLSELCIQDFYLKKNNVQVCDNIQATGTKENCEYFYLIKQTCQKGQNYDEKCVASIAINKNRPDLCNMLSMLEESEDKVNQCMNYYEQQS